MDLEPRLLRYFLAVAGELNFGRAAKRVHIEQAALSVAIKRLEEDLGVQLLERDKRHVALTEAGTAFSKEARAIIAQSQRAVALVRGVAHKSSSVFRVGYCPFIDLEFFVPIRSQFPPLEPDQRVEFRSVLTKDQILPLLEGKLDAGLLMLPVKEPELQFEVLIREPWLVVLPRGHRLAKACGIRLQHLDGDPIVWPAEGLIQPFHDRFSELCTAADFRPKIAQEVTTMAEAFGFVSAGQAITFTPPSALTGRVEGVVFRPLEEENFFVETALAYRRDNSSAVLPRFIRFVRERFRRDA